MSERELTGPYSLVGSDRRLNPEAVGWSRRPLCDATLLGPFGRRKRWNHWAFAAPDLYFVVAVVDVDYMRMAFVQLLTLADLEWREGRLTLPFVARPRMGGRVEDDVVFRWGRRTIEIVSREGGASVDVRVEWPGFPGGNLDAELSTEPAPGQESINVTIPWSAKRYHFTSKQPAVPATGTIRVGDVLHRLGGAPRGDAEPGGVGRGGPEPGGSDCGGPAPNGRDPTHADCFAALDFARGVWRYDSAWDWLTVSGRDTHGRVVGLNLGAGWTDGTLMTENGVVVDGIAHKIGQTVGFDYDARDLTRPWHIRSVDGRTVHLTVTPFYHHRLNTDLVVLRSRLDQVFGRVSGGVDLPSGDVEVDGVLAMCEAQKARW